jgi:hypothetical protein
LRINWKSLIIPCGRAGLSSAPFDRNDIYIKLLDDIGIRYGRRPSEILGIKEELFAFNVDVLVMLRGEQIKRGVLADNDLVKQRQSKGFSQVRALQMKVALSRGSNG